MDNQQTVAHLQKMAKAGSTPAAMLRYLVLDLGEQQQLELMLRFTEAFNATLGEVTSIGGWWHDDTAELNDVDINAYMLPVVGQWLANNP